MRCVAVVVGVALVFVCIAPAGAARRHHRGYPSFWVEQAHCIHYREAVSGSGSYTAALGRRGWRMNWHLSTVYGTGQPSVNRGGLQISEATWRSFAPSRWPQDPALASRAQQVFVAWRIWVHNGRSWGANNQWPGTAAVCGVR
jgi:hypothetical protein